MPWDIKAIHNFELPCKPHFQSESNPFFVRQAAEHGAHSTSTMAARAGRSSYINDEHLNCPDPGALAAAIWLRAAYNALKK